MNQQYLHFFGLLSRKEQLALIDVAYDEAIEENEDRTIKRVMWEINNKINSILTDPDIIKGLKFYFEKNPDEKQIEIKFKKDREWWLISELNYKIKGHLMTRYNKDYNLLSKPILKAKISYY